MDEIIVFGVLVFALVMFVMGKWRYDIVALASLLILAVLGIVPASEAYLGFGHPAVVTVAAVLILSRALYNSGVVDVIASWYLRIPNYLPVRITSLSVLGAFLSAFMNNVGAVSLLMPVAMRVAGRSKHPPSLFLMPLAFASLLGGMITLIGTPPNIIASNIRLEESGVPFNMFDFTLVGLGVALAGVTFIVLVGWRLLPSRTAPLTMGDALHIEDYMTEVRVPEDSRFVGKLVRDLEELTEDDVAIVGLLHKGVVHGAPSSYQIIDANDIFIIEADPEEIKTFVDKTGFALEGSSRDIQAEIDETLTGRDVAMVEVIVGPASRAEGGSAHGLHLHESFGVNLLGVSTKGHQAHAAPGRNHLQCGGRSAAARKEGTRAEGPSPAGVAPPCRARASDWAEAAALLPSLSVRSCRTAYILRSPFGPDFLRGRRCGPPDNAVPQPGVGIPGHRLARYYPVRRHDSRGRGPGDNGGRGANRNAHHGVGGRAAAMGGARSHAGCYYAAVFRNQ